MNGKYLFLSLFSISLASVACQPTAQLKESKKISTSTGAKEATEADQPLTATGDPEEERIDPPQNIIGHYLHCSYETQPTDAAPEALVGCRFDNAEGKRVPASTLGSAFTYQSNLSANSGLTVYSTILKADNRYDAMFLYYGPNAQQIKAGVARSVIKVQIKGSVATGTDVQVGSKFSEIERDVTTLPEPRTTDYSAVRETILQDAQNGEFPPPI